MKIETEYLILGGGIAGLSAAIKLTEKGACPLIIEAGSYPSHKVCGEFFSPESLPILHQWGVYPVEIKKAFFHFSQQQFAFLFSSSAGGISHLVCDPQLAQKAEAKGATILTQTAVIRLLPGSPTHEVELSNGDKVYASHLIVAAGRFANQKPSPLPASSYIGIKAHFKGVNLNDCLEMFFFKGAYLGLSPIEGNQANVACLALKKDYLEKSPDKLMNELISKNERLYHYLSTADCQHSNWMSVTIPSFGIKKNPDWPNTYFIGDAAGTIPPITGYGLSMAIRSGMLAGEYAIERNARGFKRAWHEEFSSPILWGKLLHQVMMRPSLIIPLIKMKAPISTLAQKLFYLTRANQL